MNPTDPPGYGLVDLRQLGGRGPRDRDLGRDGSGRSDDDRRKGRATAALRRGGSGGRPLGEGTGGQGEESRQRISKYAVHKGQFYRKPGPGGPGQACPAPSFRSAEETGHGKRWRVLLARGELNGIWLQPGRAGSKGKNARRARGSDHHQRFPVKQLALIPLVRLLAGHVGVAHRGDGSWALEERLPHGARWGAVGRWRPLLPPSRRQDPGRWNWARSAVRRTRAGSLAVRKTDSAIGLPPFSATAFSAPGA